MSRCSKTESDPTSGVPEIGPPMRAHEGPRFFARKWPWIWAFLAGAAATLFWFNPSEHGFYPFCTFYKTTGLLCPGCGSLRAIHQLLHGHVQAAFALNPLLVLSLPFLACYAWRLIQCRRRGQSLSPGLQPKWVWVALGVLLVFGIARNVPQAMAWLGTP